MRFPLSLSCAAALALVLVTASCGPGEEQPVRLRVVISAEPVSRDPLAVFDELTDMVLGSVFMSVTGGAGGGETAAGVVESWVNPDSRTWDLSIREGLTFHDGRPVRAEDVVRTVQAVMVDRESPYHAFVQDVVDVSVLDDCTLRVVTSVPLNLVTQLALVSVVPGGHRFGRHEIPIGCGPYRVAQWEHNTRILLRRREPAGPGLRPPDEVEFLVASSPERQRRLLTSLRPVVGAMVSREIGLEAEELGLRAVRAPRMASSYLVCNVRPGHPTADLEVRRALAASLDRDELARRLKTEQRPAGDLVPPGVLGFVPGRYRPDGMSQSVAAVPEEELRLVVMETVETVAEEVRSLLETAGFKVGLEVQSIEECLASLGRGDFDISLLGYSCMTGSSLEMFELAFSAREPAVGGWNFSGYRSPRVNALTAEARGTIDPGAQQMLLEEVGRLVLEDLPWLPLLEVDYAVFLSSRVVWDPLPSAGLRLGSIEISR